MNVTSKNFKESILCEMSSKRKMSQSQQHLIMNSDKKPTIVAQQQQQNIQTRGFYPNQSSLHMSQSQSVSFQFQNPVRNGSPMASQRPSPNNHPNSAQRHVSHQYMSKPPPDYQASMESNNSNNIQSNSLYQGNQMQLNISESLNSNNDQNTRTIDQRNAIPIALSQSYNTMMTTADSTSRPYPGIIPLTQLYPEIFSSNANQIPTSRPCADQSSNTSSNGRRPYPGIIPISELMNRPCSGESPSSETSSNAERPYPGIIPISELIANSCANESPSSNAGSSVRKPYPGIIPISELIARSCSGDTPSSNTISTSERPYPGIIPISSIGMPRSCSDLLSSGKPSSDTTDRSYSDVMPLQEIPRVTRPYPGIIPIEEALALNRGSNSGPASNVNSVSASKHYPAYSHSTSISGPYSNMSFISAMSGQTHSQASHSLMTNPTVTSSSTTAKGRGKQSTSRASNKQCNSLRQQKAPNVNVGPEGLNISQRHPAMASDWRQAYVNHNQQINSNIDNNNSDDVVITYSRDGTQEYGSVNNSINSFQSRHLNPNSPASDNPSILSVTSGNNRSQMQSNSINDIETSATNRLLIQSQQPQVSINNSFQNVSQIHLSGVSTSDMNQSNIFSSSPLPNNSLQNMVPDGSQFNLDFLDNMDCSTSDLLNFDVMQGENSTFPILDDITMLDK